MALPVLGSVAIAVVGAAGLLLANGNKPQGVSPARAFEELTAEGSTVVIVDIRSKEEVKEVGSPDYKGVKGKRAQSLAYTQASGDEVVVVEDFTEKFARLPNMTADAQVVLLDQDGSLAPRVAAELAASPDVPPRKLAYVQGGAAAWEAAELPWRAPGRLALSLPSLSLPALPASLDEAAEQFRANPGALSAVGAVAAIGASAAFVIAEFDTILELAGVVGAGYLGYKNLLFKEDREQALAKLQGLVKETGADEASEELARLARSIIDAADAAAVAGTDADAASGSDAAVVDAVAAAAGGGGGTSVAEAREWIKSWKGRQASSEGGEVAAPAEGGGAAAPDSVAEAREWIGKWRNRRAVAAAPAEALEPAEAAAVPAAAVEVNVPA